MGGAHVLSGRVHDGNLLIYCCDLFCPVKCKLDTRGACTAFFPGFGFLSLDPVYFSHKRGGATSPKHVYIKTTV